MKNSIRHKTLQLLKELSLIDRLAYEENLYQQILNYIDHNDILTIALYKSFDPEVNTQPLIEQLWHRQKAVYLSRVLPQRQMDFHLYEPTTEMELVYGKINQPTANAPIITKNHIDLIIVPGVAFQPNGQRIGFGGGYYDRYLADYSGKTLAILFPEQLMPLDFWQWEDTDIAVEQLLVADKGEYHGSN